MCDIDIELFLKNLTIVKIFLDSIGKPAMSKAVETSIKLIFKLVSQQNP